mmetsp:Transcript_10955/g.49533  ORF Transcript_10955/g.49533 Transcript_10955/m.49533 type:complete len:210 (-) Transcript_10955:188-817(-)
MAGPPPDLRCLMLGLWWQETSTDLRLATNAETASGDGTSALPSGGVFSFAEARTATGGDGVPRATFFFLPEEDEGARVVAAVAGETDFLRRAAASFTASLALTRLSLSHCCTPSRAACSRDVGVPCATDPDEILRALDAASETPLTDGRDEAAPPRELRPPVDWRFRCASFFFFHSSSCRRRSAAASDFLRAAGGAIDIAPLPRSAPDK